MLVDNIQGILEDAREELSRIEDIKADVGEMEARATEAIDTLEELSYALGEAESLADDANNLGVY